MICPMCGLVVGDRVIDVGSEWRTFSNEKSTKDNSRVGGPENSLFDGSDMSTMIATGPGSDGLRDQFGKPMYRNRRTMNSSDRALHVAVREIRQMADRLNVPKMLVDRANNLFKQVHEGKSLKGRSSDAIVSACMYLACRQEQVPRTFKEICAVSKTSKKEIGRVFKLILKNLETNVDIIKTGDYMSRFCTLLGLSNLLQKAATHIAKKAQDMDLVPGKSPVSVAAAAIYMASQASDDKKTPKEVSDVTGVAEVTIRLSYKAIIPKAVELFPKDFKFSTPIECLPLN
ncbi:transcription initiation factor iib [Plakobranchus ocellatus]|uniref:Transcription initiation factor IIB n=1 Tax=Plakobranchus ocellatus TaxID=259542 RepID=A0AAV4AGS0_9GAST|nr:transcription initiation factor iib [Plakobranchus ocellatus]